MTKATRQAIRGLRATFLKMASGEIPPGGDIPSAPMTLDVPDALRNVLELEAAEYNTTPSAVLFYHAAAHLVFAEPPTGDA